MATDPSQAAEPPTIPTAPEASQALAAATVPTVPHFAPIAVVADLQQMIAGTDYAFIKSFTTTSQSSMKVLASPRPFHRHSWHLTHCCLMLTPFLKLKQTCTMSCNTALLCLTMFAVKACHHLGQLSWLGYSTTSEPWEAVTISRFVTLLEESPNTQQLWQIY
jgi:hypothetical protein